MFCIIDGLFWFSLYIYIPIVPTYAVDLGSGMFMVGLITGSYGFMQMLLRIPVGIASDKLGNRRSFIIGGIAFAALAGVSVCFIQNPMSLLVSRVLGGTAAAAFVLFSVHFSLYFKAEEGAKSMGIINAVNSTGQLAAVLLCGIVSSTAGRVATFEIGVVSGLVALILSIIFVKDISYGKRKAVTMHELVRVPLESGQLLLISFLGLVSQYMTFATLYGFTPIIARGLKANDFEVSMLLTFFIFPAIVSSSVSGKLSYRFGGHRVLAANFILFAVDCLVTPFMPSLLSLYAVTIIGGFAQGILFATLMGYVVRKTDSSKLNTAMGFYQAIYGLGMFMGPVIVGTFSSFASITWGFVFTAVTGVAAAALSMRISAK